MRPNSAHPVSVATADRRSARPSSTARMARARGPLKAAFSAQRSAFSFRPTFDLLPGHRDERQVLEAQRLWSCRRPRNRECLHGPVLEEQGREQAHMTVGAGRRQQYPRSVWLLDEVLFRLMPTRTPRASRDPTPRAYRHPGTTGSPYGTRPQSHSRTRHSPPAAPLFASRQTDS